MPLNSPPRNPYIAGKALGDERGFFGRADIFRLVETALSSPDQNGVVLFGQRRIGKTSILLQLRHHLPSPPFRPIYFELMDRARKPLNTVLYELAATTAVEFGMAQPQVAEFEKDDAHFQRIFLPALYQRLNTGERPVFLFDEFDVLDVSAEEQLPPTAATNAFRPYLRNLMSNEPRLAFVFVIGRKAEDLSIDVKATFKTTRYQRVSVLDDESARQLIGLAERNGALRFSEAATNRLLSLTARHPYFTQLMCQLLFDRAHAASPSTAPTVDAADVDAIAPKALEAGENIFEWIWDGLPPAERVIFSAIAGATADRAVIAEEELMSILQRHGIRILTRELELAPKTLIDWEMLRQTEGGYGFFIELMRRWVAERKPLPKVKDELDRVNPIADQHYRLGYTYYRMGNLQEAMASLQSALQVNPNHLKARLLLGETLREQGQLDEAVKQLEEAYRYDEDAARHPLVNVLLAQAQPYYDEYITVSGPGRMTTEGIVENPQFIPDMMQQPQRKHLAENALKIYGRVLEISPREAVAQQKITEIEAALRTRDMAVNFLTAQEAVSREEWSTAADGYKRLIELDPQNPQWPEELKRIEQEQTLERRYAEGLGMMQQQKWAEAQRIFADTTRVRPGYRDVATQLDSATRMMHPPSPPVMQLPEAPRRSATFESWRTLAGYAAAALFALLFFGQVFGNIFRPAATATPASATTAIVVVATATKAPIATATVPSAATPQATTTPATALATPVRELARHSGVVRSVAFSPDGKTLASGSDDNTVRLWRVSDGATLQILKGHTSLVRSVAFSPKGDLLASGAFDGLVKIWSVADGKLVSDLAWQEGAVYGVAFSPDGTLVASAHDADWVKLGDVHTGKLVSAFQYSSPMRAVAFQPDGKYFAAGSADGSVRLYAPGGKEEIKVLSKSHKGTVSSLAYSQDGNFLASASEDGTINLWNKDYGFVRALVNPANKPVQSIAFAPDGKTLMAASPDDSTVRWWNVDGTILQTPSKGLENADSVAFSPDGSLLATGIHNSHVIQLWDVKTLRAK